MIILIMLASAGGFWRILPSKEMRGFPLEFRRDRVMDYLSVLTVVIFFVCAVFLTFDLTKHAASNVNETSTRIVVGWTTVLALTMLAFQERDIGLGIRRIEQEASLALALPRNQEQAF